MLRAEVATGEMMMPQGGAKVVSKTGGMVAVALRSAPRAMVETVEVAMVGMECVAPAMRVLAKQVLAQRVAVAVVVVI